MKKQTNKRFLAKKWSMFGIFVFAILMFNNSVFAEGNCEGLSQAKCLQDCYWDEEANEGAGKCIDGEYSECASKTWAGCTLSPACGWYEEKCHPKSSKSQAKAFASLWKAEDCNDMISGTDINNGTFRYLKTGKDNENKKVNYSMGKDKNGKDIIKEKVDMDKACVDLIKNGPGHPCDYPSWLTSAGKSKCRAYDRLMNKAVTQLCLEKVENIWEHSIKNETARIKREDQRAQCKGVGYNYYEGPVFSGPGLRGGSQMAQMELSNSISKQRDLTKLIIDWASFILEIAAVIAVVAIMWAGFRYITDMGDGAGIEAAKKIIIWTVVGLILILSSYALVNTVMKAGHGAVSIINNNLKT